MSIRLAILILVVGADYESHRKEPKVRQKIDQSKANQILSVIKGCSQFDKTQVI